MSRQFGLTSRETVRGNQSPGSHYARDTQRDFVRSPSSFLQSPRSPFESCKFGKPPFDEREFSAGVLFSLIVLLPPLIVALGLIIYLKLVS